MQNKTCTKCKQIKDVNLFSREAAKKDGRRTICKDCDKARWSTYAEANRQFLREKDKKYHELNRENDIYIMRKLLKGAKKRAKENDREFSLALEDLPDKIPERCPILGIQLSVGRGKSHANSPSLDRIDPNLGYTKENYQIISHRANTLKNNATIEELKMVISHMEKISGINKSNSIW